MAIGTAYIKIMPEAAGIQNTLGGVVDPAAEKSGKTSGGKWTKAFKTALVGAAVGKWIGDSVLAGADLEQSIGGIETLYKGASDKMMQYASQAYKTAGIDANTYMQQATSFSAALIKSYNGDVDKAADATNQAMIDMADNANKMGTPLESIQNAYAGFAKQNYTMLDNLKLGYGGTKTEMERLLADAEKITGVHYDINELGDVYEAVHVIQTELGITGTTSQEAATTISGSIGMMKSAYKDLIANLALGEDVMPQIIALGTSTVTMLKNVIPAIGNVLIGIPKTIIAHFPEIAGAVKETIRNAILVFMSSFPEWSNATIQTITKVANTIFTNMPLVIDKIKGILTNAIALIVHYAPQILKSVLNILLNIGKSLLTNLPNILNSLFNLGKSIVKTSLTSTWHVAQGVLNKIISGVSTFTTNVIAKIRNGLATVATAISSPFKKARDLVKGIIDKIKGIFPLNLGKIFNLKLPHFHISGGKIPWGIGGAGTKPSISVEWYAKGGIMTKPTLFGGGEAGTEAIMPLDPFWAKMDRLVDGVNAIASMNGMTVNVYGTSSMDVNDLADAVEQRIITMQKRKAAAWL